MNLHNLNPYIHLNGTAKEAIQLYETALGAKLETLMKYDQVPGMTAPPAITELVLHSCLKIGAHTIMISDATPDRPAPADGNVQIMLDFADTAGMEPAFAALAEGGTVVAAIHDSFWGAKFGAVTDRFGVRWLFHCATKQ